jgi:hypothetical protein
MKQTLAVLCLAAVAASAAEDTLVFSYFMKNGEDGLYLATSTDGLQWKTLNQGKPLLRPEVGESKLMRDPSIVRAPDGMFHMVWTTSWQGKTIGYSSSKDLVHWSPQRAIDVMPAGTDVLNCWAPEIFYDDKAKDFVIVWASTIKGRFPETLGTAGKEYNHRLYVTRTRDFKTMTPAKLFYDPGFIVIDGALFRSNGKYAMVVKNETQTPPAKYLFLTYASSLDGPWSAPGKSISGPEWAEGASPIQIGGQWYIYFDKYRNKRYGAIRSKDLENWEDITSQISLPEGARHGTAFRAPAAVIDKLR